MPIRAACTHCQKAFTAPDSYAGKHVKCPGCGQPISIPAPEAEPSLSDLLDDMVPVTTPRYEESAPAPTYQPRPLAPSQSKKHGSSGAMKSALRVLGGVLGAILGFGGIAAAILNGAFSVFGESPSVQYQKLADRGIATFQSLLDEHMKINTAADAQAAAPRITQLWDEFIKCADEEKQFTKKKYRMSEVTKLNRIGKDAEQRIGSLAERLGLRIGVLAMQGEIGRIVVAAIPESVSQWSPEFRQMKAEFASVANRPSPPPALPQSGIPPPVVPTPTAPQIPQIAGSVPPHGSGFPPPPISSPPAATPDFSSPPKHHFPDRTNDFERKIDSALLWKKSGDLADLIRADVVTKDDRAIVEELKWVPGLKRPALNLYWGFSIEPIGIPASIHTPRPGHGFRRIAPGLESFARPTRSSLPTQNFIYSEMEKVLGPMLGLLLEGMQQRVNDGKFGVWKTGSARAEEGLGLVGVSLIPACSLDQQMRIACDQGMDALLVARVEVKPTIAQRATGAKLKLLLVDPQLEKTLWESEPLDSKVALDEEKGAAALDGFAETMFNKLDDQFVVKKLPEVKSSVVPKRVAKLSAAKPEMALQAIVEIRYYVCKGLLTNEEAKPHYAKLLGTQPAEQLTSESAQERQKSLAHLLEGH